MSYDKTFFSAAKDIFARTQERFVAYYVDYLQEHATAQDMLGLELPNILVAIQICETRRDWPTLGFLIHTAQDALLNSGQIDAFRRWLELALSDASVANGEVRDLYLVLLSDYAGTLSSTGEREQGLALYRRLLHEAEGDRLLLALAHFGLATVQSGGSQNALARYHWEQARAIAQELNEQAIVTAANYFLEEPGNHADVLASLERAHSGHSSKAASWRRHGWCQFQAMRHFQREEYSKAFALYQEAFQLATTLEDQQGKALSLFHLGEIARVQHRLDEALDYLRQSENIASRISDRTGLACIYKSMGRLYLFQEEYSLALPYLRESVSLESEWGETQILAENLYLLGYALANTGEGIEAQRSFLRARAIFERVKPDWVPIVERTLTRLKDALSAG